jgi:hypothetical protein
MQQCRGLSRLIVIVLVTLMIYVRFCLSTMNSVSNDLKYKFSIGTQDSVEWNEGAGLGSSPFIKYSSGRKTTQITLVCTDSATPLFEALGEDPENFYKFRLSHECACWDKCSGDDQ